MDRRHARYAGIALACAALGACATTRPEPPQAVAQPPAPRPAAPAPRVTANAPIPNPPERHARAAPPRRSAGGRTPATMRPYQVRGVWYQPAEQPDYDETGMASWYGDAHHGRSTSNGETFDMNALSAAHKTLPLPSTVEVTNLDNGRTIRVRVNDRGPFAHGRIIDLSRAAAEELGFRGQGTARVRVRVVNPNEEENRPILARAADAVTAVPRAALAVATAPIRVAASLVSGGDDNEAYAVQGGTFADRGNAERLAERLSPAGRARIVEADVQGRRLYRVLVGGFGDANEAERARLQVAALGVPDARVVRGF